MFLDFLPFANWLAKNAKHRASPPLCRTKKSCGGENPTKKAGGPASKGKKHSKKGRGEIRKQRLQVKFAPPNSKGKAAGVQNTRRRPLAYGIFFSPPHNPVRRVKGGWGKVNCCVAAGLRPQARVEGPAAKRRFQGRRRKAPWSSFGPHIGYWPFGHRGPLIPSGSPCR